MGVLHWPQASLTWAPQFSRDTSILRVPASLRGHAREVLMQTLPSALEQMTGEAIHDRFEIDVRASEEVEYDDGSTGVEPGYVSIIAERFTELFEPDELRHRLDALANDADKTGNEWAARDEEKAERFLRELTKEDL